MFDYEISNLRKPISGIIISNNLVYADPLNDSSEIYVLEVNNDNEVIKKYKILDEEFNIFADGENIILTHPQWSLSGMGESLIDAERNLYKEAKEVFGHYNIPNSQLTPDAIKLKEFLHRLI